MIMGPSDQIKKYEDVERNAWEDFFVRGDSIEEPKQVVVNMLEGMKMKSILYELPYYKDILMFHL